jgi:hypothetical protein
MTTAIANQGQHLYIGGDHTNVLPTFIRELSIPTLTRLQSPASLVWWEWRKVLGIASIVVLAILAIVGCAPHPLVVAMLLHITADFTCQTTETALRKKESDRHLLIHALVAGGLPMIAAGLATANPVVTITWTIIGVFSHYAVDWTRKFGLRQVALGIILDQACHLLTILILVLAGWQHCT